jgi:hypothetical protein
MEKANADIRQYMADRGVSQRALCAQMRVSVTTVNKMLKTELSQREKERLIIQIDGVVAERDEELVAALLEGESEAVEEPEDKTCTTKFQVGDRVEIPSRNGRTGVVFDIWSSLASSSIMYAVTNDDDGHTGMYAEDQLKIAPVPIEFTFNVVVSDNAAIVTMDAKQGGKDWVYARGHAHILHDGEVGMAQAVSYAARRMFESLDRKQPNKIYFKED